MQRLTIRPEILGMILAVTAYLCFSLLDTIQKTLIIYYSVFQILFIKYFFTFFLSFFESKRKKNPKFYLSKNWKLQIFRSLLSLLESCFFILAFKYLSLADAHSVGAITPTIVVVLSYIFLKEKISFNLWIAIFIGFIGVLIVMRPGLTVFDPISLIPLIAALFLSLYQIVTRKVSEKDENETSLFYAGIVGIFSMGFMCIFYWKQIDIQFIPFFIGVGISYSLAVYFQIIALSKAKASIVQPFHYTLIFWSIIFGYIFYNDIPDLFTVIGALIISSSGIYIFIKK